MKTLAAHTRPSGSYPGYINVSRDATGVRIIVRGDPTLGTTPGHWIEGPTSTLFLTIEEWRELLANLVKA